MSNTDDGGVLVADKVQEDQGEVEQDQKPKGLSIAEAKGRIRELYATAKALVAGTGSAAKKIAAFRESLTSQRVVENPELVELAIARFMTSIERWARSFAECRVESGKIPPGVRPDGWSRPYDGRTGLCAMLNGEIGGNLESATKAKDAKQAFNEVYSD